MEWAEWQKHLNSITHRSGPCSQILLKRRLTTHLKKLKLLNWLICVYVKLRPSKKLLWRQWWRSQKSSWKNWITAEIKKQLILRSISISHSFATRRKVFVILLSIRTTHCKSWPIVSVANTWNLIWRTTTRLHASLRDWNAHITWWATGFVRKRSLLWPLTTPNLKHVL